MNVRDEIGLDMTRRELFRRGVTGVGGAALASLLPKSVTAGVNLPLPHGAPRAKNVIYLFQNGGPTHVDMFDYKPELAKLHGKPVPESYMAGKRFSTMSAAADKRRLLAPLENFRQYGQSGAWVSDVMPYTAKVVDDLCFIKSMHTESVNHAPGINFVLSGSEQPGRPSMGAWMSYGIGSDNENLPAFVVMTSVSKGTTCGQIFYDFYWGSGFLPSRYQGVKFRGGGDPVLYLSNPDGANRKMRRKMLDHLAELNSQHHAKMLDPEINARISQYEMAFRMQASVPELTDLSDEPDHVIDSYGPQARERGTFAHNCLMARRLVERGTRFVQVMHAGWDQHNTLTTEFYTQCKDTDQPAAALIQDLKQRGLLDETLVIWGGEFGRTPFLQGDMGNRKRWGRDHHPYAYTMWMAGGGVKPGITYGASDDLGMNVVQNPVHVHDLQATILNQVGIDHEKLTYLFQGRHFRLTDVHGHVVRDILKG